MTRIFSFAAALLAALFSAGSAHAQSSDDSARPEIESELARPGGLTAEQAAERAVARSRELEAARAELEAADAGENAAELGYLPQLTLLARYTRLSEPDAEPAGTIVVAPGAGTGILPPGATLANVPLAFESLANQYTLQANLVVPVSDYLGRLPAERRAAEAQRRAATHKSQGTERDVTLAAKIAYYSWARARLGIVVAERAVKLSRAHAADVDNAMQAGSATSADVARVRSEVARSELFLTSARSDVVVAEHELRARLHDTSAAPYAIGEDLRVDPVVGKLDSAAIGRRALERRSELHELDARAAALSSSASAQRSGAYPRFELFGTVAYQNPDPRAFPQRNEFATSWQAGAQLVWVPTAAPQASARAESADASSRQLMAQRRALADRIETDVVSSVESVNKTHAALASSAASLAAAEEGYRARRLLFQNGRATSSELLDAEQELIRAELAAVDARIDIRLALAHLEAVSGGAVALTTR